MLVPPLLLLRKLILSSSLCELYRTSMLGTYVCMSRSVGFKPQTDQEVQFKSCSIGGIKVAFFKHTLHLCHAQWVGNKRSLPSSHPQAGASTLSGFSGCIVPSKPRFAGTLQPLPSSGVNTDMAILSKIKDHKGDGLQAPPLIKLMQKD